MIITETYEVRYATKRGGSGMTIVSTNEAAKEILLKLFKQRLKARVEKNKIIVGEVCKIDTRWTWYIDIQA